MTMLEHVIDAQNRGHVMEWDPPAALTAMKRWTCSRCYEALLVRPDGTAYGNASGAERCTGRSNYGKVGDDFM